MTKNSWLPKNSLISSKSVSFLLAASICLITVLFLSLVNQTPIEAIFVAGSLSFSSSFIFIYATLEFLIFKEVENIYLDLDRLKNKDFSVEEISEKREENNEKRPYANPLKRINQEIADFAVSKEEEIDKLKRLEAYRKEFIADVSHELKTPIFAAQGYLLTLLDGAIDDHKVRHKFLRKAAKSLNRLDTLVQDLLTLSHIESGVITFNFELVDLHTLILDVFDQLEERAQRRHIKLLLEVAHDDGYYVNADYNRMMQVMVNLVNNAIKYNHDGGWVKVKLSEQNEQISVSVEDNGLGISQEHIDRIFERFYRVEKSRSKRQGGSGLGLAIVKHILEGHNTVIKVESKFKEGTNFHFNLPKSSEKENEA